MSDALQNIKIDNDFEFLISYTISIHNFDIGRRIMKYGTREITSELKTAREGKQLTQRALSALAGVPQAHISKIESGAVDLKLSSLIELARVLDLEPMLIPRNLVPAVEAIVRGRQEERTPAAPKALRELKRLQDAINHLQHTSSPHTKGLDQLQKAVQELTYLRLGPAEADRLHAALTAIRAITKHPERDARLSKWARELRDLRNRLVHGRATVAPGPRPAYSLEDEDDDA
jgi:transcriptional regulator with XRE-family HTH domain